MIYSAFSGPQPTGFVLAVGLSIVCTFNMYSVDGALSYLFSPISASSFLLACSHSFQAVVSAFGHIVLTVSLRLSDWRLHRASNPSTKLDSI